MQEHALLEFRTKYCSLPNHVYEFMNDRLCLSPIWQGFKCTIILRQPAKNVERTCEFVSISSMIGRGIICSHGHVRLPVARSIIDDRFEYNWMNRSCEVFSLFMQMCYWRFKNVRKSRHTIISFHTRFACEDDLILFN